MLAALTALLPAVGEFPVVVQRTEAAARCQLKGPYLLVLGQDAIQLREPTSPQALYTWPYRFLRKFGADKVRGWRLPRPLVLRGRGWRAPWPRVADAPLSRPAPRAFSLSKLAAAVTPARASSPSAAPEPATCAGPWRPP